MQLAQPLSKKGGFLPEVERTVKLMEGYDGPEVHRSLQWRQSALSLLLVLLGAFCLLKYLGWAWGRVHPGRFP